MLPYFSVIPRRPGVFCITDASGVCTELFVGYKQALLLDTGYGFVDIHALVRSITALPLLVVNTHGHADHVGGNGWFTQAAYIHSADRTLFEQSRSTLSRQKIIERSKEKTNYATGVTTNLLPKNFCEEDYMQKPNGSLEALEDGMLFELGGMSLQAIHLPGHTAGSTGLWDEDAKVLYLGDAMNNFTWLFLPESQNRLVYLASIEKAMHLCPEQVVFGHYTEPYAGEVLKDILCCAQKASYEEGAPFTLFGEPYPNAKLCSICGMTMQDVGKPQYFGVVSDYARWKAGDEKKSG